MASEPVPRDRGDFNIAVICTYLTEIDCVVDALDRVWDRSYGQAQGDENAYILGRMGEHDVVIVLVPSPGIDLITLSGLRQSFPGIELTLQVGLCSGIPQVMQEEEISLGDVVISDGLLKFDFRGDDPLEISRSHQQGDDGVLPRYLRSELMMLQTKQLRQEIQDMTVRFLEDIQYKSPETHYPGTEYDNLYDPTYAHKHHPPTDCAICSGSSMICKDASEARCDDLRCSPRMLIFRSRLAGSSALKPTIHIGTVGLGSKRVNSGYLRDKLASLGIIAIDKVSPGGWDSGPMLFIKGVCNYADGHKPGVWTHYAAATAAACAKAFLLRRPRGQRRPELTKSQLKEDHTAQHAEINVTNSRLSISDKNTSRSLDQAPQAASIVGTVGVPDALEAISVSHRSRNMQRNLDHVTDSGYGGSGLSKIANIDQILQRPSLEEPEEIRSMPEVNSSSHKTQTLYSDSGSLRDPKLRDYATAFAAELYRSLPPNFDKAEFERTLPEIDELLQAFALSLRREISAPEYGNLIYVVYRYRSQIIESLRQNYNDELSEENARNLGSEHDMTIDEKMSLGKYADNDLESWRIPDDRPDNIPDDEIPDDEIPDDEIPVDTDLPDLETYQDIIRQSQAYQQLLQRMTGIAKFEHPGPVNAQRALRNCILKGVSRKRQFSRDKAPCVKVEYHVDWNISSFHAEQQYSCTLDQIFEQVITITGYENNVQAATCLQYIDQTWGKTGVSLIDVLREAILNDLNRGDSSSKNGHLTRSLSAGLSISVFFEHGEFTVVAIGLPYPVSEIGEILAWLGASLQSFKANGAALCRPAASFQVHPHDTSYTIIDGMDVVGVCRINFQLKDLKTSAADGSSGYCWLNAFRSPVIVDGFPILRRSQAGSGLEVSVDMMISLLNTNYLVDFCQRTYLKGFSTMLVVIQAADSTIYWHLFQNNPGMYISYEDVRVPRLQNNEASQVLDVNTLSTSRHILGWCEKVSCLAGMSMFPVSFTNNFLRLQGTRDAKYNLGWSGLADPHSSCAFEKISITAGKYLTVGTTIAIGLRDRSVHGQYDDDYLSMVQMISERHFVIYDVIDRRAVLLDGASTLLHLLRAFLRYSEASARLKDYFIFEEDDLLEPRKGQLAGDAAFWVLANEKNQLLPLWSKLATRTESKELRTKKPPEELLKYERQEFCLRDRILQICRILQQITAHQDDAHSQHGVGTRLKATPRRQIEGFDFMDIATQQGTLWPKVEYINAYGEGWVDITRRLHCVTLFGTGFGSLLKPVGNPCNLCMANIPQGPDVLGITITDLRNIMKKRGAFGQSPLRIVHDIFWYVPDKLFESCECDSKSTKRHDRVQVFLPTKHPKLWTRDYRTPQLIADGAILVGHSFKCPLRWGGRETPVEGIPRRSRLERPAPHHDSGIGSSKSSESAISPAFNANIEPARYPPDASTFDSSSTAVFMHANKQFTPCEIPESGVTVDHNTSSSSTSGLAELHDAGYRAARKAKSGSREQASQLNIDYPIEEQDTRRKTEVSRQSNIASEIHLSQPTGKFSAVWTSLGTQRNEKYK